MQFASQCVQLELNQKTMAEVDSRLQKHLTDWEIEKETMLRAAMIANDECLKKDQTLTSVQASHAMLQSQLHDVCSRETKLSHALEEVRLVMESTRSENEMLRSKAEELFLVVNQQGQEICRQEKDFELKLRKADEKVEDTRCQMKAILADLDALILMKEKLEADIESIEQKSLHHCSSVEQQLVKSHEDKNQLEDLFAERENELLEELNNVKSENVSFGACIQALEGALEESKVLIKKKEEEMAILRRDWTDLESKTIQTQEKLRASTLLAKELTRSEEQWKIHKEALASENKRLTRCMACREMEFSSLQGQKEGLEKHLKEAHEKERMTNMTLSNLKEHLKVLEKQWQVERELLKDRLVAANRELVESQELKHAYSKALEELEEGMRATEKKSEVTICALETQWNTAREEMSSHLTQVSQDFIEVKHCAEKTQLDLAKARSLVSAADAAIEQLLEKSSMLEGSNKRLLEGQEALRLELSHWEQYAVELHKSSCVAPSPLNDDKAIAASEAKPFNYYFDLLKGEVERSRRECENLRAEVLDKESTILSIQMELSCTIASSRQVEIELECVADERSHLKLELNNMNRALANAQDEVRCREVQLEQFEGELHKVMEILVKTEEKMDESERGWRKQIEAVKEEMEAAKLCAIEKASEVTMLRRQFEQGQTTLQEAELLVNALVQANDSAKLDVLKWKSREENMALQSSEMLSMIEEEVSVTMDRVENQMQVFGSDIHGIRTLLTDSCSEIVAGFNHELQDFLGVQISEIDRATEEANMKLSKMNAKVIDLEQRLYKSVMENETLQITLANTEESLRVSEVALEDAMQNIAAQDNGWAATRDELQGALASLAEKNTYISESTSECDRISEVLEKLRTESREELTRNAAKLKETEMEKLTLAEATDRLQAANNHLHGQIQQLEMSVADDLITKQVMEVEIASLRQLKDFYGDKIHNLEADLAASREAVIAAAAKLQETELTIQALNTDLGNSRNEMMYVQRSLDNAVTEMNNLRQHAHDLEEEEVHLRAQAETQGLVLKSTSDKLLQVEADSDAAMEILATMLEKTSSDLHEKQTVIANLEGNHSRFLTVIASLQVAVSQLRQENEFLSEKANALDDDNKDLLERLEMLSKQICKQSEEASTASAAQELQLEILKTIIESASSELQEKDYTISVLQEKLEQSNAQRLALDNEKNELLEQLQMLGEQLHNQSQEASAALAAHQMELEILKNTIECDSIVVQEKDQMISALREDLEQSSAQYLALDDEKKNLLEQLRMLGEQLRNQSQEASAASAAHHMELGSFKTTLESAFIELQEKDRVISVLREELEQSSAQCLALDDEKKNLLEQVQKLGEQLGSQSQEASAALAVHHMELESFKTTLESASIELQEKDRVIFALREKLEESSLHAQKMLNLLEKTDLSSARIEHERDELLETTNNFGIEKEMFKKEIEIKSQKCADLDMHILSLQTELQDVSTETCQQKLELEILTTMLESAVKESREKDAMASDLENLLSQSQLQNAEMLQSSQEVVNHFSLFQSQLDACFQQNRELERNKLVLTAEVHSRSQEIAELKEQRQAFELSLDEMRASFAQLQKQKDEELRALSDEFERLKSLEAVMEADLWDWEQRCQDAEVQFDEKDSELEILRGKLLTTQEECKEQVELIYDELQGCQLRIAEMDSERRDLINEIEESSAIVAELQEKLQTRENDMEEHFSRHSIEQEVLDALENEKRELQSSVKHLTSEVAAHQQRASAAENMQVETRLEMEALERDLKQKDDLLQSLESDLNLLQESALHELRLSQELESLRATTDALQQELNLQKERRTRLEIEIGQVTEEIVQIRNQVANWKGKAYELETELDKKRQTIESLEDELRMAEQNMVNTLEEATSDLKDIENDRDRLQVEVLELTEQLELTQAMVEERDAVASELQQVDKTNSLLWF
jgi:chromosome segregation ATPase